MSPTTCGLHHHLRLYRGATWTQKEGRELDLKELNQSIPMSRCRRVPCAKVVPVVISARERLNGRRIGPNGTRLTRLLLTEQSSASENSRLSATPSRSVSTAGPLAIAATYALLDRADREDLFDRADLFEALDLADAMLMSALRLLREPDDMRLASSSST